MDKKIKKLVKNIIVGIIFCIILVFLYTSFTFYNKKFNNIIMNEVSYESNTDIKYKVYLHENDYFEEPFLGMNKTYISSLIDYIDIDFNNITNFSEIASGNYTYYINATISANKANSLGNDNYWSKTYLLTEPETVIYKDKDSFSIDQNIKIDYQKYNEMLSNFKKEYNLAVDGNLKVNLVLTSTNDVADFKSSIPVKLISEVNIPLTQQVIDVSIEANENNIKNTLKETVDVNDNKVLSIIILMIISFIDIIAILAFSRLIYLIYFSASKYHKTMKKILTTYDSIIVNVKELPNVEDLNVVEVGEFGELLDAHNEVRMPINFIEEEKNKKSTFMIITSNMVWVYKLYNEEYKLKKGKK